MWGGLQAGEVRSACLSFTQFGTPGYLRLADLDRALEVAELAADGGDAQLLDGEARLTGSTRRQAQGPPRDARHVARELRNTAIRERIGGGRVGRPRALGGLAVAAATVAVLSMPAGAAAAPGDLDTTFAGDGARSDNLGFTHEVSRIHAIAQAPGGEIVVAGTAATSHDPDFPFQFAVARYTAAGALDTSFGGDGVVSAPFANGIAHA